MAERKRRKGPTGPELVGAILDRAGENRFSPTRPPVPLAAWLKACGPRVAERARPAKLEQGTLLVRVATSAWAHELSLLSTELIARLRDAGVDVRELRFHVGPVEPLPRPPGRERVRRVPPPAELPPTLANAVARIEDDELREAIAGAARASLGFAKTDPTPPKRR